MSICRLENISKSYKMGELVEALTDINLDVNAGDFISIEGPSGTGKSTLLYVIGTLLAPDEGKLYIDGREVSRMSDSEMTRLRGTEIGFIFQDSNLVQALTLRENLEFVQGLYSKKDSEEIGRVLEALGLSDRADFLPHQLSGGQRRRAMIARALIHQPKLILADEPTNDLDDKWSQQTIDLLKEACKNGAAVIMVTHNSIWAKQAIRRYSLDAGKLSEI
ncbi:MAG: ABC transporter ATP-binding protein [Firmicutes bacterium]|nr:ABC transporter ATP-binding protein [Bacillota bacterium]